jgi:DNA-binding SARP family transcriptional activator/biotin operon repressor
MSVLRICLLGGLTLAWGDAPLSPVAGVAARSLLAYLVTYRDRPHTRDLLVGTFWPDLPDSVARRRLSQSLWQIRRALRPHPALLIEGDTVQFNPDLPLWLDVEQFEQQVASGKQRDETLAADSLLLAVELYQGDFLAGYYDDWVLVEQERLREAFLGVLERLVGGLKARGDYEGALACARRLVAEDPLREEAHCEVMRLCHLLGRDNEALQQYQICRRVLADELDAEPSASTVALAAEIAVRAGVVKVPHLPVAPRPSPLPLLERPDQVPLVGRQAERAELARYLELAMAGSGGLAFLVGEAGVGKTRLMQEVARDAAWRGVRVGWGHSCELCAPPPYQSLVEVLHDADLSHLPAVWRRELGRLMPELGPPPPAVEPEQARGHLLEALARAFLALAQAAPHLVILEDVHWMDPASFEALRVMLPRLPASRLLVVGTLRPEELAGQPAARQSLAALEATRLPRRLELAPLSAAETEALVQRVLDLAGPAPRFSQRLYAGTEGNPFFITETLRALVDEGLLYRDEAGGWRTPWDDATEDYAELPVPPSIAQSIEQWLARLAPAVRNLLGVAAVIGRQVEVDLWLAASKGDEGAHLELAEGTVLAAAEELARRGLLVEMDEVLGYRFVHDTVRQVVYEGMSPMRRRWWHRQVAAVLETLHPDRVEALARHYRLGQKWPQAVRYALRAGERARAVYANQQALDHYRRADAWLAQGWVTWPADEIARWRADLAEKQGRVYSLVGEYQAAQAAFARARQMWADLGDRCGVARALNRLSFLCFVQDDYGGTSHHAELALAALPETDPPADLRATSLTYLGLSAWTQGHYDDALSPLEKALALFEEIGTDLYGLARCLNSLGLVHLERGDLELADHCFARSLALRQQIGDRRGEAWCWHNQGRTALARGDLTAARERLAAAQAIFAEIQHPYGLDTCARFLAEVEQAETAARETSQVTVRLPRADAPTGRPLRDDEYVTVTWTVDAPEDAALHGKVARRRQRILRLLAEAQTQGATPRDQDLAAVLGVSLSALRRDMAALRAEGHDLLTRWRKMTTWLTGEDSG